jgi:enoyl-CoA hydratase/carnithine racemase
VGQLNSTDIVQYDSSDHVATITLNRPDKLNALSNALVAELRDASQNRRVAARAQVCLSGCGTPEPPIDFQVS